jgi:hypothetical protein
VVSQMPANNGGPGRSRTADQRFRKPLLYPTELRGHCEVASLSHVNFKTGIRQESPSDSKTAQNSRQRANHQSYGNAVSWPTCEIFVSIAANRTLSNCEVAFR